MRGAVVLDHDHIWVMLVGNSYVPKFNEHSRRSHIFGEVQAEGYEAGGKELSGCRIETDKLTGVARFTADDVVWPKSSINATGCVFFKGRGKGSEYDELIACLALEDEIDYSLNGDFWLEFSRNGILELGRVPEELR